MAYNVTKRFREIVYSGGAIYKCSLKINNKLVSNRQIAKITISNPIIDTTSDYFYVGSYIAQKLTIKFKNLENLDIKSNNDVSLDISLDVDGTEVNVPIGKFLIDDLSENYYETCEITCLDYSVKAKNNIDYSPCFVDGKATIDTIFEYICNHFGITFDTNYPKTNGDIEVGVYDSTVSGKRYISYIAELKGCNAKHGRDGILYLIPLKQTSSVSINALKSKSWKLGEKFQISGVSYDDGARPFKAGDTTNNTLFIRNDNPFIQDQTTIDNIYNVVKDTVIWNLKTENYGDISLDPWDNISYQLGEETYNTLMNVNLTYEMNISSTNEVKLPTKQQEQTTNVVGGDIQSKLLRVGRTIDLINGTIKDLSEKIVDISAQASGRKEVKLENCSATPLYKLKITGDDSLLFPGDKKKYFTYETYEGSSIDADIKGSNYDINNLSIEGKSTQETNLSSNNPSEIESIKGKNLWDLNSMIKGRINEQTGNIEYADNTTDLTINGDEFSFTVSQAWASGVISDFISVSIGDYVYSLTTDKIVNIYLDTYDKEQNRIGRVTLSPGYTTANIKAEIPISITDDDIKYIRIHFEVREIGTYLVKEVQLEKGTIATKYAPYDNIQIINNNKNLFDENGAKEIVNYNISLNDNYKGIKIWLKPNTKYSISRIVDGSLSTDNAYNLQFVKEDKNTPIFYLNNNTYSQNITDGTITFTTENTGVIYLASLYGNDNRLSTYFSNVNVQLEEGETVTYYEPYQSQTLNTDLQGNELCSIENTKDILDISVTGDTEINKKIGKIILDGSETWKIGTAPNQTNTTYFICESYDNIVSATSAKLMSDYFLYNNDLWLRDVEGIYFDTEHSALIRIRISKNVVTTVDEFKTWLSTHNVTVLYELVTPETINLNPTKPLYLYDGINHLTNDNVANMVAKMVKSTMFLKTSDLYVNQGQSNEKIFDLKIPALRELNGIKDEYNLENTKATLTKRIGLNVDLEEYILDEPQIIDLGEITVELNEGTNVLTMPSFPNNYYEVTYLLKNEYTDTFANQAQVSSMINIASDEILIRSKTEILENGDELIASINTKATGDVLIDASRLAQINADKINFNSYDFNVTTQNMRISIGQGDNKKDIINANGVLTNLQFKSSNQIWGNGQSASYPLGFSPEAEIQGSSETYPSRKSYLQIDYDVPENFVISNAYITIFHTPIYWDNGQYHTWGYCRNLGIFKVTNSGNFVISLAFFGEGETIGKFNTEIINNAFEDSTYWTARVPNNDSYLSENITTKDLANNIDKTGHGTLLIQSNDIAPTSNTLAGLYTADGAGGKTGSAYAILNIIGYTKV